MRGDLARVGLLMVLAGTAAGQQNLSEASLEELLNTQVTSASKKEEKLSRIAAAVFVINAEDIRRSGATNLPDVLRMAPGVDVQQVDASVWAISIRGFNSRYSNKVLVTIDGRSVYSPSFSGVYWDQEALPVEEIERIEIIRGPGATIWGANGVNGVINVLTKSAKDTKRTLVSALGGTAGGTSDLVETGGGIAGVGAYRLFGQFGRTGDSGPGTFDHWSHGRAGFRSDWDPAPRDSLTVEGDLFLNRGHALIGSDWLAPRSSAWFHRNVNSWGGSLLARWDHTAETLGETALQANYTGYTRNEFGPAERVREVSLSFQHHIRFGERHDVVWGLCYRASSAGLSRGFPIGFSPPSAAEYWYSAFVQDDIRITRSLSVTVGDRVEYSTHLRNQDEPSVRVAWMPGSGEHTFWASAANADRQPSRVDTSIQADLQQISLDSSAVSIVRLIGNPEVKNEELMDYEVGYRGAVSRRFTLDVTAFLSLYSNVSTWEPRATIVMPGTPVQVISPMVSDNLAHAKTYGGELAANWNVNHRWRLRPAYSLLQATLQHDSSSPGLPTTAIATDFPQNQIQLRSLIDIDKKIQFDQTLYYTARLPRGVIPGHTRLDLRLSRRVGENVEASVVGQNLLRNRTIEYGDAYNLLGAPAMRTLYGRITWLF